MSNIIESTLGRMRDLVVVNSTRHSLALSQSLRALPVEHQRQHFGGDQQSGFVWLYRDDALHPDMVLETVVSPRGDAVTSVYMNHSINQSLGEVMRARKQLIAALEHSLGMSQASIGIDDYTRGRALDPAEVSTGQLIDLLAERAGAAIFTSSASTSSHGGTDALLSEVMP